MKYKEDLVLKDLQKHIDSTYKTHYTTESGLQALDMWDALGSFDTSCRDAAIKYLFRFGKKNGQQKEDLLKAIHFIMLMYQYSFLKDVKPTKKEENKPKPKPVIKIKTEPVVGTEPNMDPGKNEDDMGMKF